MEEIERAILYEIEFMKINNMKVIYSLKNYKTKTNVECLAQLSESLVFKLSKLKSKSS